MPQDTRGPLQRPIPGIGRKKNPPFIALESRSIVHNGARETLD